MDLHIHQTYTPQGLNVTYQDFGKAYLQPHYAELVVFQQDQMCRDPLVQHQIYAENLTSQQTINFRENLQQRAPIDNTEDIKKFPISREKPRKPTVHVCDICNKTYCSTRSLASHYVVHTRRKHKYGVYHIQPQPYSFKSFLQRRNSIDFRNKPHVCKVCNKVFTIKQNLAIHCLYHTGQKPYVCDICRRRFATKAILKKHSLIHSREKNPVCKICNKSFTSNSVLHTHYLAHFQKGKSEKNAEKAKEREEYISKAVALLEAKAQEIHATGVENQQQKVDLEQQVVYSQTNPFYNGITSEENSGFQEHALMCSEEQQVYLEKAQPFTIYQPLTLMFNQAFNTDSQNLQPLITVNEPSMAQFGHQTLQQIEDKNVTQIGNEIFTIIGQQPCTTVYQQPITCIV